MYSHSRFLRNLLIFIALGSTTGFAASLTVLEPPTGVRVIGVSASEEASRGINFIGDVNGDGLVDMAMGAPLADRTGNDNVGKLYVVFGRTSPFAARDVNPSSLNGSNGFVILGANLGFGSAVTGIGDFNGDGRADFAVSELQGGVSSVQSVYVIYGKSSFTATLDLLNAPVGYGFRTTTGSGVSGTQLGVAISGGNFNNDSLGDLVVSEYAYQAAGNNVTGRVMILFGQNGGSPSATLNLDTLGNSTSPRLVSIVGSQTDGRFGFYVFGSGDLNGDSLGDLLVGSPFADSQSGRAFVVYGRNNQNATTIGFNSTENISAFSNTQGRELTTAGATVLAGSRFGTSVVSADVTGDGKLDVIVGAQTSNFGGRGQAGAVVVLAGTGSNATQFSTPVNSLLTTGAGFLIGGAAAANFTGTAIGSPGDVSGDGIDDLLIGAHGTNVDSLVSAGQFYIFYGSATPFAASIDLATPNPDLFEVWTGESAQAAVGFSMANQRGDFNGDNRLDVLVGGLRVDTTATDAGASYLILRNRLKFFASGFEVGLD